MAMAGTHNLVPRAIFLALAKGDQVAVPMVPRINVEAVFDEDNYFPKEKFEFYNGSFYSKYLVFSIRLFSITYMFALHYLWKTYHQIRHYRDTSC